jgi:hypothetical protein
VEIVPGRLLMALTKRLISIECHINYIVVVPPKRVLALCERIV